MTPTALSKSGVPDKKVYAMDEFPLHGLGLHDDYESWSQYQGYVWYGWTTRKTQPMHIDPALQMLIDQYVQLGPNAVSSTYIGRFRRCRHSCSDDRVQGESGASLGS